MDSIVIPTHLSRAGGDRRASIPYFLLLCCSNTLFLEIPLSSTPQSCSLCRSRRCSFHCRTADIGHPFQMRCRPWRQCQTWTTPLEAVDGHVTGTPYGCGSP